MTRGLAPLIPNSTFRAAFEEHAPYRDRMALIPIKAIVHEEPGLFGAAQIARRLGLDEAEIGEGRGMEVRGFLREAAEHDASDPAPRGRFADDGSDRDLRRPLGREAIDSG